ncbi:MAG: T9SS type A sorting domain-containing protein [Flavobacteriales bacterium]|nr:T9SS type A sorting domain-containing protein [Flavobacteriales bacterium]
MKNLLRPLLMGSALLIGLSTLAQTETEPNDVVHEADALLIGQSITGTQGIYCQANDDNDDYFYVQTPKDGTLIFDFNVSNSSLSESALMVEFLEFDGTLLSTSIIPSSPWEEVESTTLSVCAKEGTQLIRLIMLDPWVCTSYSIECEFKGAVFDGDIEPNNSQKSAIDVSAGFSYDGRLHFGTDADGDIYRLTADDQGNILVDIAIEVGQEQSVQGSLLATLTETDSSPHMILELPVGYSSLPEVNTLAIAHLMPGEIYYLTLCGDICGISYQFIQENTAVGVNEVENVRVEVYPNPSSGDFLFVGEGIQQIIIYDIAMKEVEHLRGQYSHLWNWDATKMESGFYMAYIYLDDGQVIEHSLIKE